MSCPSLNLWFAASSLSKTSRLHVLQVHVVMMALFKIVDLTKSDPTGVCQITEIEQSPFKHSVHHS